MTGTRSGPELPRRADRRPFVVVHGGAERYHYRNVLDALETALAVSADYFEFDVRSTADGVLVVHHDETIGEAMLGAMPFAEAQRAAQTAGYELPRFDHVLSRATGRIRLDVELKQVGLEDGVLRQLDRHGFSREQFVVTSFEQRALDAIHALDGRVATGLLVYDMTGQQALASFRASGTSFLGPDHAILDDATLAEAASQRIRLMSWTVNDAAVMRRLLGSEAVIGLITDDPVTALAVRSPGNAM
jgi:glycerophosphoryl diester phosphodiesterase